MRRVTKLGLLGAVAAQVLPAVPAYAAQADGSGDRAAIEEVIVTARRREEQLNDVPVSVISLTGEKLKEANVKGIEQIQYQTPSLSITTPVGSDATAVVSLRGQAGGTFVTLDPSVGIYLDDVYLGRANGAMLEFLDMDRVEVLNGPQGTLYGRNTTGGALKLISRKANAAQPFNGHFSGQLGNFDFREVEGAVNIPIVEDKFAIRLAGRRATRDGYTTLNIALGDGPVTSTIHQNDMDYSQVQGNAVWTPTAPLMVTLGADYYLSENNNRLQYVRTVGFGDHVTGITSTGLPTGAVRSSSDFYTARNNGVPFSWAEVYGVSLTTNYEFNESLSGKVIAAYRRVHSIYNYDADGSDRAYNENEIDQPVWQRSVEAQLNGSSFDRLDWIVGLFTFMEKGSDFATVRRLTSSSNLGGYVESKSNSAFGHGTYRVTDKLNVSLGARYTQDDKAAVLANNNVVGGVKVCAINATIPGLILTPGGPDPCLLPKRDKFSFASWSAAVDYHVTEDVMVYVRGDSSSRSGGQNLRATTALGAEPFNPETATALEVGVKGDAFDGRLTFALDYYYTYLKDLQYTATIVPVSTTGALLPAVSLTKNATGASNIQGVEFKALARLTDKLGLEVGGSVVKGDLSQPATAPEGVSFTAPERLASAALTYARELAIGRMNLRLEYAYKDRMGYDASRIYTETHAGKLPAYSLWNANAVFHLIQPQIEVGLWVRNLLDEEYFTRSFRVGGLSSPGRTVVWDAAAPGEPRMFGARVTKRW